MSMTHFDCPHCGLPISDEQETDECPHCGEIFCVDCGCALRYNYVRDELLPVTSHEPNCWFLRAQHTDKVIRNIAWVVIGLCLIWLTWNILTNWGYWQ